MIDLNDLRVFERVAALRSFSRASRQLGLPRSSVSRDIQRLEAALGIRLLQRTTREVILTEAGAALFERCAGLMAHFDEMIAYVSDIKDEPSGSLTISAGIGFGVNVLSEILPEFMALYPKVDAVLDLSGRVSDLIGGRIDVAIRMGPLSDSRIVARKLGTVHRYLCASPDYLRRKGTPDTIAALRDHDLVDLPVRDGRRAAWSFTRGEEAIEHRQDARLYVNCALTIHRMLLNGAGIGMSSGYLCGPEFASGRLVRLLPEWRLPSVPVHAIFPSRRHLAPTIRAFVDFMVRKSAADHGWQSDPVATGGS